MEFKKYGDEVLTYAKSYQEFTAAKKNMENAQKYLERVGLSELCK